MMGWNECKSLFKYVLKRRASRTLCVFSGNWAYMVLNAIINVRINPFSRHKSIKKEKKRRDSPHLHWVGFQYQILKQKSLPIIIKIGEEIIKHTHSPQTCLTSVWASSVNTLDKEVIPTFETAFFKSLIGHCTTIKGNWKIYCIPFIAIKGFQHSMRFARSGTITPKLLCCISAK